MAHRGSFQVIPEFRAKSYSVSAERPGEFDITLKVYPHGRASGYLNSMELGQSIGVWRRSQDRTRRPGQLVALVAYGVAITVRAPPGRCTCIPSIASV